METIVLVGGLFFAAMVFLRAFLSPPPPQIIYVESKPPAPPQAQSDGGIGCLLWLVIAGIGMLLILPGVSW
jgi:hypothetical protein